LKLPTELASVEAEIEKGTPRAFLLNLIHPRRKVVGVSAHPTVQPAGALAFSVFTGLPLLQYWHRRIWDIPAIILL